MLSTPANLAEVTTEHFAEPAEPGRLTAASCDQSGPRAAPGGPDQSSLRPLAADPACAMAHGDLPPEVGARTLVVVFVSPVASYLLHFAGDLGFRTVLVEPDPARRAGAPRADLTLADPDKSFVDADADVVVTDHDRPELGDTLQQVLQTPARWVGVIGSLRHTGPGYQPMLRVSMVGGLLLGRIRTVLWSLTSSYGKPYARFSMLIAWKSWAYSFRIGFW